MENWLLKKDEMAQGHLFPVHAIRNVNLLKKMKPKKLEKERGSFARLVKREISVSDAEDSEFFILVQIILTVNLQLKQNQLVIFAKNAGL